MPGVFSFQTEERLLSRLAFETFLLGTAMVTPPNFFRARVCIKQATVRSMICLLRYPKDVPKQPILDQQVFYNRRGRR